jgi:hypothetical protein
MLTRRAIATPGPAGPLESSPPSSTRSAKLPPSTRVVAIGVGALGPVEPRTGLIRSAPTIPGFNNIPLGPRLQDALQLPVQVHNDANAATIAEWQLGAGRGTREFCYVTVSTGIGFRIITNGQLVTGRAGYAGELGRTRIPNAAGGTTELEQISSGTAIAARALPSSPPAHPPAWPPSPPQTSPPAQSRPRPTLTTTPPAISSRPPPPPSASNSPTSRGSSTPKPSPSVAASVSPATSSGTHSTPRWKSPSPKTPSQSPDWSKRSSAATPAPTAQQ